MKITRQQLLEDLRQAYLDARRHKRNKPYQLRFEATVEEGLEALCEELWGRSYRPCPSTCFIVTEPKRREVFAASFRDRIVHHLYFNYTHEMYERTFIEDTYSCIKGRGTHYGIRRLYGHILSESQNYQVPCYVLKADLRGYFMHIDRRRLVETCNDTLDKMASRRVMKHRPTLWRDVVDMDFVRYLTEEIAALNPIEDCRFVSSPSEWEGLPHDKSLFHTPEGCGLPIGNLTSQLFSNVYMNVFDQYAKRELGCRHYGRYVDDFYVVSADREWLESLVPKMEEFLRERLGLSIHEGKTRIASAEKGVEFLGAFLLPHRVYLSRDTLLRMDAKLGLLEREGTPEQLEKSLNSYCGVLSHWNGYNVRKLMLLRRHRFTDRGLFDHDLRRFVPIIKSLNVESLNL